MAERGLPQPEMVETAAGFKLTLHNDLAMSQNPHQDTIRQWMALGLNERQIAALGFLSDHGRITNNDYQTLCPSVSSESLRRDLADLVDRDMLLRIGEKRATFYILK
jgi:ATP-dependent DNA helicase RecG